MFAIENDSELFRFCCLEQTCGAKQSHGRRCGLNCSAVCGYHRHAGNSLFNSLFTDLDRNIDHRLQQIDFRIRNIKRYVRGSETFLVTSEPDTFSRHFLKCVDPAGRPAHRNKALVRVNRINLKPIVRFAFEFRFNRDVAIDNLFETNRNRARLEAVNFDSLWQSYLCFISESQNSFAGALIADVDRGDEVERGKIIELVSTAGEHYVDSSRRIVTYFESLRSDEIELDIDVRRDGLILSGHEQP